ncbi:MAG: pimeloyl-ACP methyl ester esterase BioH [Thiothrix sp.]|nr:MAG: pimeloyl-ACP methyl ester esterase BioH [Thiothrix sp.]
MSQLFTITEGQGRPVVALHGWGMNQLVWQPIRARLSQQAQVTWVDLPGHGRSANLELGNLDELIEQLLPYIPTGAILMGWSLGGIIAQALVQRRPKQVAGLVLIASTPRFVVAPDWPYALSTEVLQGFADNLEHDYAATVRRFFALQFMGTRSDPLALNHLREQILQYPASLQALRQGLAILRTADCRHPPIQHPCLWLLGRLDKLIPNSLAEGLQGLGYTQVQVLAKAAHLPFVTHPDEFLPLVENFIHGL